MSQIQQLFLLLLGCLLFMFMVFILQELKFVGKIKIMEKLKRDLGVSVPSARDNWIQCINAIQDNIISQLSDHLTNPALLHHPSPILLIDPAYHNNVGDNLITYGELVLMEMMGFMNHTECSVLQS